MSKKPQWTRISAASQCLRIHPSTMRRWARQRRISARREGRVWEINISAFECQEETEGLLTTTETAARLGICVETVRRQVRSGQIQAVRIGKRYRISCGSVPEPSGQLLTVVEASTRLKVSIGTIRRWIRKGQLQAVRAGRRKYRVLCNSLCGMLDAGDGSDLLTVSEAAAYQGVHPETIRRWIQKGWLKAVRVGNQYRIPRSVLDTMDCRKVPADLTDNQRGE